MVKIEEAAKIGENLTLKRLNRKATMVSKKQNCWEYMNCGREPGGTKVAELGACPAAADESFNGINFGTNGGRICWALVGSFCPGESQGAFAQKLDSCTKCDFYKLAQV